MSAFAFALPYQISYVSGSATLVDISFSVMGGDGNNNPVAFGVDYNWDATLPVSTNLAALKSSIAAQCLTQFNLVVLSTNVNILMTVS